MGQGQVGPPGPMGAMGPPGPPGPQGDLITDIDVENGKFIVKFSNGKILDANAGGPPGPEGVGIKDIDADDGNIKFTLSDGTIKPLKSEVFKSAFLQQNTLWCGETAGSLCNFPLKNTGISWGTTGSQILLDEQQDMSIRAKENLRVRINGIDTVRVGKDGLSVRQTDGQVKNVMTEIGGLWQETNKLKTSTSSTTTIDQLKKDIDVLKNKTQKLNESGDAVQPGTNYNSGFAIGKWRFTSEWWDGDDSALRIGHVDDGEKFKLRITRGGDIKAQNRTL